VLNPDVALLCLLAVCCTGCGSPSWQKKAREIKSYFEKVEAKSEQLPTGDDKGRAAIAREFWAHITKAVSGMRPLRVTSRSPDTIGVCKAGKVTDAGRKHIEVPITFKLLKPIPEDGGIRVYSLAPDKSVVGSESNYVRQMFIDASDGLKAGQTYTAKCKVAWDYEHPEAGGNLGSLELDVIPCRQ
jgi:hypothetical protein